MTTVDSDSSGSKAVLRRYKFREAVLSDIGRRRNENQDAYGIAHTAATSLFVVADGMGGARGGATASAMAVHVVINEAIKQNGLITRPSLKQAIEKANAAIYARSKDDEDLAGMGTTIVALAFVNECAIVAHVGDSRIYRLRDGELQQLTHDHTLVQELVDSGAIPKEEAENHPIAHMLTRSLGPAPQVDVEIQALIDPTQAGDRFLLCSDGLYNLVNEEEIAEHLREYSPEETGRKLVDLALERGGTDNVTVETLEVLDFEDDSLNVDYPPAGELRFVFSEGVAAPELKSLLEVKESVVDTDDEDISLSGEELNGDTLRDMPAVTDEVEEELLLEDIAEEALAAASVSAARGGESETPSRLRTQLSAFIVVGLTAGIFGFFLYQYSGARSMNAGGPKTEHTSPPVEPDAKLAQDLTSLTQGDEAAASLPPVTEDAVPHSIPSMKDVVPEDAKRTDEFSSLVSALKLPEVPYIQIRDPKIAGIEANRPIVWENEEKKLEKLLNAQEQRPAAATETAAVEQSPPPLLTSQERAEIVESKRVLRDRIIDIDSKLKVLGVAEKEAALTLEKKIGAEAELLSGQIVDIRREIQEIRDDASKWNSRLDLTRGSSAMRLADEVSSEYGELRPVFESFSRHSEAYTAAVEAWQTEPNNVELATAMGARGRELQQARIALEQELSEFVAEQMKSTFEKIAMLRLKEDLVTLQRDQLSRYQGYLRGYTELTAIRRKELRDGYYKERGEYAEKLRELRRQFSDEAEVRLLLEQYRPESAVTDAVASVASTNIPVPQ